MLDLGYRSKQTTIISSQSGYNYTIYLAQEYSQYNITISAVVNSCGCGASIDIEWSSSTLTNLGLGDSLVVTGTSTFQQFLQGVYADVNALSESYVSSSNSTLQTLGNRYAETLPSINYTITNLPTSLQSILVREGEETVASEEAASSGNDAKGSCGVLGCAISFSHANMVSIWQDLQELVDGLITDAEFYALVAGLVLGTAGLGLLALLSFWEVDIVIALVAISILTIYILTFDCSSGGYVGIMYWDVLTAGCNPVPWYL